MRMEETVPSLDWIDRRLCGIHMTIRDVDCEDFDVDRMVDYFVELGVDFFSFFAAGYITTYPTELELQRISPFLKEGRDLTGEIIEKSHAAGIKAIAMADLGPLPEKAAVSHPDWCSRDKDGKPYRIDHEHLSACPMSDWQGVYAKKIVAEIVGRYPSVDGIKFGGNSYGFGAYGADICYCVNCRRVFKKDTGLDLPLEKNWNNPTYRKFIRWRYEKTTERVRFLYGMVKSFNPDLLFMGNSVCFGHPDWTLRSSLDQEYMSSYQDAIQIEAQDHVRLSDDRRTPVWQSLTMSGEEANYMTNLTGRPIWIVASYFHAWPWRRSAMQYAEQKAWLAQIIANGANPMINLSGGPPAVHEDVRGFKAPREIYSFLKKHREYYEKDRSAADVAIIYSQESLVFYGRDDAMDRYVEGIRGMEQALKECHIQFDIVSSRRLKDLSRYRAVIAPNFACMDEEEADALRSFVKKGGGLVAGFETSLYDHEGQKREDYLLGDLFGLSYLGLNEGPISGLREGVLVQGYAVKNGEHAVLAGLEGTELVPADFHYCAAKSRDDAHAEIPLTLYPSFRVFPEGLSYSLTRKTEVPLCSANAFGAGRTVYFNWPIDKAFWKVGYTDHRTLIANAVEWVRGAAPRIEAEAPASLDVTVREQNGRTLVHFVNLTGGRRLLSEVVPVRDVAVRIPGKAPRRAFLLSTGARLPLREEADRSAVVVPEIRDYEVLVIENA